LVMSHLITQQVQRYGAPANNIIISKYIFVNH
jgi:hypothetical protein